MKFSIQRLLEGSRFECVKKKNKIIKRRETKLALCLQSQIV